MIFFVFVFYLATLKVRALEFIIPEFMSRILIILNFASIGDNSEFSFILELQEKFAT